MSADTTFETVHVQSHASSRLDVDVAVVGIFILRSHLQKMVLTIIDKEHGITQEKSGVISLEHDLLPRWRHYRSGLLLLHFLLRLPGRM